jgi:cyclin-dependent kinase 7
MATLSPPLKRLKLSSSTSSPSPASATTDLAEQLDAAERSKYIKGKKLGEGQYADVFSAHLATDPSRIFAIKKIKVKCMSDD